jgi:hypothetical protein
MIDDLRFSKLYGISVHLVRDYVKKNNIETQEDLEQILNEKLIDLQPKSESREGVMSIKEYARTTNVLERFITAYVTKSKFEKYGKGWNGTSMAYLYSIDDLKTIPDPDYVPDGTTILRKFARLHNLKRSRVYSRVFHSGVEPVGISGVGVYAYKISDLEYLMKDVI